MPTLNEILAIPKGIWIAASAVCTVVVSVALYFFHEYREILQQRLESFRERSERSEQDLANSKEAVEKLEARLKLLVDGEPEHIKGLIKSAELKLSESISLLNSEIERLKLEISEKDQGLRELSSQYSSSKKHEEELQNDITVKNRMIEILQEQVSVLIEKDRDTKVVIEKFDSAVLHPFIVASLMEEFHQHRKAEQGNLIWAQTKQDYAAKMLTKAQTAAKRQAESAFRIEKKELSKDTLRLRRTFDD